MNRAWQIPIAVLAIVAGFFGGQYCGAPSIAKKRPTPSSGGRAASDAPASIASANGNAAQQEEALGRALRAMLDPDNYHQFEEFYAASRELDVASLRVLQGRLLQVKDAPGLCEIVAERLVELDPGAALAHVRSLGDGKDFGDRTMQTRFWARKYPEAALAEAEKNPNSGKSRTLTVAAITGLAQNDPAAAISRLPSISDPKTRGATLDSCLTIWARNNPHEASRWMKAHPETYEMGSEGNYVVAKFAGNLTQRDPAVGRDFAESLPEPLRAQALRRVTGDWSLLKPKEALTWGLENGVSLTQRDDIPGTNFSTSVVSQIMQRAPTATFEWIESLPVATRGEMAAEALRTTNAALAEKLFAFVPEEDRPETARHVMWALNKRRAGDALKWSLRQPEGPVRVAALTELMQRYRFDDPIKQIDGFPAGQSRDAAYASYVEFAARNRRSVDAAIIPKIANTSLRAVAAQTIYRSWSAKDAAAAKQWLATTPDLTPEIKRQIGGGETAE